ncbi:MAG: YciI family protein [Verrucomicrobiales bacterium]
MPNPAGTTTMNTHTEHDYLVISRGQWDKDVSPTDIQQAIDDFYVWLTSAIEAGKMKMGSRLGLTGATVSKHSLLTDGPFGEAKEAVGGYWFIVADTLEEAAQIAAGNPCMKRGLFYEIRPLDPARCPVDTVTTESAGR